MVDYFPFFFLLIRTNGFWAFFQQNFVTNNCVLCRKKIYSFLTFINVVTHLKLQYQENKKKRIKKNIKNWSIARLVHTYRRLI